MLCCRRRCPPAPPAAAALTAARVVPCHEGEAGGGERRIAPRDGCHLHGAAEQLALHAGPHAGGLRIKQHLGAGWGRGGGVGEAGGGAATRHSEQRACGGVQARAPKRMTQYAHTVCHTATPTLSHTLTP